jgi:drug/metabolite transporter (DMT)-like permease
MTASAPASRDRLVTGNLLGAGSMIAWAAGFPAAEALIQDWSLPVVVAGRFVMALLLLIPIWIMVDGPGALARARWGRGLWIGALGYGGGAITILLSQAYTDPVTVAIFAAATPLCATVVDWIWLRKGFTRSFLLGLIAAIVGGLVATGGAVPGDIGLGALFALASAFLFSWATLMLGRDLPDHSLMARTTVSAVGAALAMIGLCAAMLALGRTTLPADLLAPGNLGLLAIYGMASFAISQILWIASAERLGIAIASFHINIAPFWTMLILLALGGGWSWPQAAGAAIVAMGVVLAQR